MTKQTTGPELPSDVLNYLSARKSLTLATSSPTGSPHAATLVYVNEGVAVYFSIRPDTRTAQNIAQNAAVAFTIDEYSPDWTRTEGVQGGGECRMLLDPAEIRRVHALFRAKFPFVNAEPSSHVAYFRIQPTELNHIRNQDSSGAGAGLDTEYRRNLVYSIFRDLPRERAETLSASLGQVEVAAGEVVVRQGAPGDKFFIIVQGEVEVVHDDSSGRQQRLATLKAGQFFGEIAVLRDQPRTASVRALVPTTLLTMERETFRNLIAGALSTTQDFDRIIRERLSAA
jgi:uncharacterized protein YhbP (UPF0306 family)